FLWRGCPSQNALCAFLFSSASFSAPFWSVHCPLNRAVAHSIANLRTRSTTRALRTRRYRAQGCRRPCCRRRGCGGRVTTGREATGRVAVGEAALGRSGAQGPRVAAAVDDLCDAHEQVREAPEPGSGPGHRPQHEEDALGRILHEEERLLARDRVA